MRTSLIFTAILLFTFAVVEAQSPCLSEGITFSSQEEIDNFQTNYPGCSEITGTVFIQGEYISNLNGLSILTSIAGYLYIVPPLFGTNSQLTDLVGLNNLISVGKDLHIEDFIALNSLNGLEALISIGQDLRIEQNHSLTSLAALENLSYVGGGIDVFDNPITSLGGLDNIAANSVQHIYITANHQLSECDIKSICDYLATTGADISIVNNAPGCDSREEVEEACAAQGIGSHNLQFFIIHANPTNKGTVTLNLDNPHNLQLTCFNTFGQQVYRQEITGTETVIDVSTWSPGIYLAVVHEDGKPVGRSKFVVQ